MTPNVEGQARWERVESIVDLDALRARRVLVVGLGSGGSTVALELAKAGVGRFTLVDHDLLEERNVVRHECDDRYLGWNKAEAVADLLHRRNPDAQIEAVAEDAFTLGDRLGEAVRTADLVAGCTDAEAPKHLVNRLCVSASVPAVYGGVYEAGVGGEVIRCSGGPADPCYACVTSVLKESAPAPSDRELDYGVLEPDGTVRGTPGLGLDVRLVALIHAKLCFLALAYGHPGKTGEPAGNVVLFGTARVEGLFPRPFASAIVNVAPQDGCLVCAPLRERGAAVQGDAENISSGTAPSI